MQRPCSNFSPAAFQFHQKVFGEEFMKNRKKLLIVLGMGVCALALMSLAASNVLFVADLKKLETERIQLNMSRVLATFSAEMDAMKRTVSDWAIWDDTYSFMKTGDSDYPRKYLQPEALAVINVAMVLFVDTHGRLMNGVSYDPSRKNLVPVSEEDLKSLLHQGILPVTQRPDWIMGGVVLLPRGPVIISSHDILKSDGSGPSAGTLIMARRIDPSTAPSLAGMEPVPVSFHHINDKEIPADLGKKSSFATSAPSIAIRSVDSDALVAYYVLKGSGGVPAVVVRTVLPMATVKPLRGLLLSHLLWVTGIVLISLPFVIYFLRTLITSWRHIRETSDGGGETRQEIEYLARSALEMLPEHIAILDENGTIIAVNQHWKNFTPVNPLVGTAAPEGANYLALCEAATGENAEYALAFAAGIRSVLSETKELFSLEFSCKSGETQRWYLGRVSRFTVNGRARIMVVQKNITDLKDAERDIRKLACYDPLSGLPNRFLMHDRLTLSLARAKRNHSLVAVLLFDLDCFKLINESFGHSSGDILLSAVALRLSEHVRESDTLARMGGDEFVLILNDIIAEEEVVRMVRKILDSLSPPFEIGKQEVFVGVSVGIALYPADAKEKDRLLKCAETAMYQAKKRGGNSYQFYSAELNLNAEERLAMETNLRYALEREELSLHFQPWRDLKTGTISGMEALLRWRHPVWGYVSPEKFIPVAEETGLLIPLGEWVLRTACTQAKMLQQSGFPSLRIAVNLSGRQMKHYHLLDSIKEILATTGLNPACLELEITESCIIDNVEDNVLLLHAIKQLGVEISIDDFGTGYSSLNYLKCFPIDKIKIDQSFVRGVPEKSIDSALTQAIIAMSRSLHLKVIAEGVETEEQLVFLRENGCDEVQGYHICPPLPIEHVRELLTDRSIPCGHLLSSSANEHIPTSQMTH